MASDAEAGDTVPCVAERVSCAPLRSTSPSLRATMSTDSGTPTSTTPGSESVEGAGAGPLRTVSARRSENGAGESPRSAEAVASSCSQPGPGEAPCTEPLSVSAPPAGSVPPETERVAASAEPPPAVTRASTWPMFTSAGATSWAENACWSPSSICAGALKDALICGRPKARRFADVSTVPESGPRLQRMVTASVASTVAVGRIELSLPNTCTGCPPTSAGKESPPTVAAPCGDTLTEATASPTSEAAREVTSSENCRSSPLARSFGATRATSTGATTSSPESRTACRWPSASETWYRPGARVSGSVASMTPSARRTAAASCTVPTRTESESALDPLPSRSVTTAARKPLPRKRSCVWTPATVKKGWTESIDSWPCDGRWPQTQPPRATAASKAAVRGVREKVAAACFTEERAYQRDRLNSSTPPSTSGPAGRQFRHQGAAGSRNRKRAPPPPSISSSVPPASSASARLM